MFKKDLRPYELSLWTLQDSFITILKPLGVSSRGQIETPKCRIKNDGTQELNFSIPMYYRENGTLIENPIWYNVINGTLIVNLRKLKLIFNKGEKGKEEVIEFVISKITETHTNGQLSCEVTAEGLAFQELGKIGYKVSLNSQDYLDEYNDWAEKGQIGPEPINNIDYWCKKIFKNSYWDYEIQMDWSSYDGIVIDGKIDNDVREINGLRRTDKIYEEEYISSWQHQGSSDTGKLIPAKMESFKEKLRLVDLEKSNIYNLTQNLAEAFGVFCKYKYEYDENYHIIGKKCIFYNNFLFEKEGKIDIIYPYDTSKIAREIDSADIVTKMFVTSIEDNTSPSGLVTIADVSANKTHEDYILNFDYLYSIGSISEEQYASIADYERSMYLINTELEPIPIQIANLQKDLTKYEAQKTLSHAAQNQDKERMEQAKTARDAVLNNKPFLSKNKENPLRGTLLKNKDTDETYYIKITQEGVDTKSANKYLLSQWKEKVIVGEGEEAKEMEVIKEMYAYGIRLFYYAEDPETKMTVLKPYEENSFDTPDNISNTQKVEGGIYPPSIGMEFENNNLVKLTGIKLKEDAISKNYFITCAYSPQLHYQNIYDIYVKKLNEDEALEREATIKIEEINNQIKKLEEKNISLLEKKQLLIADFENMMGPALREGSWQAENYTDYGSKFTAEISPIFSNSSHINFVWDTEAFDGEEILFYETGVNQIPNYYFAIDLSRALTDIADNLNNLSFIYDLKKADESTIVQTKQMVVGSEALYAFIKEEGQVKPILLLLDKNFSPAECSNFRLGVISSKLNEKNEVQEDISVLSTNFTFIEDLSNCNQVYPRLEVNSLLLKTSEKELVIKYKEDTLRNYYDYSILVRKENYYITLKEIIMLKDGIINKTFNINYSISNAALSLYLDALEVSKTNAMPQVSYTLEISAMNENFINVAYQLLNRIVSINDIELKFENVQGYISELDLNLESPWEDKFTVQNYRTKFEDLFSTIVASTEQMKTNSFAYNNAANSFGPNGLLKPSTIQNSINQIDLTYAFQSGNLTIDEINGIWARSEAGVVAMRGGGIFCATETDSNGNWLWHTGIMPSGINASLITAGQLDTNLIKIYAGNNLRLQLNGDGLFAYNVNSLGEADLNQYVVHNSNGLFLTQPKLDSEGEPLSTLIDKVEISWDGLIIRDRKSGDKVFYTDDKGNLTLTGNISANTGKIGPWLIQEQGLATEDGMAGLMGMPELDEEGKPISDFYDVFWVTGVDKNGNTNGNQVCITNDGTLWCNNIFASGFISANSFIGNTSGDEINGQLRNISIAILTGSTFTFNNRNYDNNLITEPDHLYFRIQTNSLVDEELKRVKKDETDNPKATEDYSFFYNTHFDENGVPDENFWKEIKKDEDGNYPDYFIWKPQHLTFMVKSDIMLLDLEGSKLLNERISLKIQKSGKQRVVENGEISYQGTIKEVSDEKGEISKIEEPFYYTSILDIFSESHGVGQFITQIDPPSYTFIEESLEINKEKTQKFSVEMRGFSLEEAYESYWLINGGEERYDYQITGVNTQDLSGESGSATLISDESKIIIAGTVIETDPDTGETPIINGAYEEEASENNSGITLAMEEVTKETGEIVIVASAIITSTKIPEGGNILLTFCLKSATRSANCFRIRNGIDGTNIVMRSTSGTTLTTGDLDTELSIEVYRGMKRINAGQPDDPHLFYVWKKDNVALSKINISQMEEQVLEDMEIIPSKKITSISANIDGEANLNFFSRAQIYITASDFGMKSNYSCYVFDTLNDAVQEYRLNNINGDEELNIPIEEKEDE